MTAPSPHPGLPLSASIGLRCPHMRDVLEQQPATGWLEVHAENYMNPGAAASRLEQIRAHYTLSIHGVGLSLGSARGIDRQHLARLTDLCRRFEPAMVSEHLSWSVGDGIYLNDLLPLPCDEEALEIVASNISITQDALKRQILIENLSAYVGFTQSTMSEPEFLGELATRTGCGLLLDINNVHVSAHNLGFKAEDYIAKLPAHAIAEVHLAGHALNRTENDAVLIDNHGSAVSHDVWALYARTMARIGRRPTLIEWDSALPPLTTLLGEAMWADLLAGSIAFSDAKRRPTVELPPGFLHSVMPQQFMEFSHV